MIDRKEMAQELMLRETVRKAIKVVSAKRNKRQQKLREQEEELRLIIRNLIKEGTAVASVAKHDSTGINALEDLLRNTNVLSTLETGYKSLTTDKNQRDSYKNHILAAVEKSLAPEESRKGAGEDVEITEEVDIAIGDRPEDDPDFIDVNDEETEEVEVDEKETFGLEGEDKTGRNRAFTDFQDIEKNILTSFDDLDDPKDISMFEEYLLKNLALYFEKFESELQTNVAPPEAAQNAVADDPVAAVDPAGDEETAVPEFSLQEIARYLDIDDIIENLL